MSIIERIRNFFAPGRKNKKATYDASDYSGTGYTGTGIYVNDQVVIENDTDHITHSHHHSSIDLTPGSAYSDSIDVSGDSYGDSSGDSGSSDSGSSD